MRVNRRYFIESFVMFGVAATTLSPSVLFTSFAQKKEKTKARVPLTKVIKSDEEWKRILTPDQYFITRQAGTEAPYSSPLLNIHESGTFECVCCDLSLFSSKTKFESGTGWPSFWAPIDKRSVLERTDHTLSETRTEVLCARCDAHLGHVFDDGPMPTGLRYCMNGVALKFTRD
jgi:peptide-methionine (R)-S-oxide reductase